MSTDIESEENDQNHATTNLTTMNSGTHTWMEQTDSQAQPPSMQPEDDNNLNVEEVYTDFAPDPPHVDNCHHCTTSQKTALNVTSPIDTNIDPDAANLQPTDYETTQENSSDISRIPVKDRPNSALPKRLNITTD